MHKAVLINEVIEYLQPERGGNFIDCTVGGGGHLLAIAKKLGKGGQVLGIDWDEEELQSLESRIKKYESGAEITLKHGNFKNLKKIAKENSFVPADGILFDLGMSSWQLDQSGRGFSLRKDEPLDMRFSAESQLTAAEIVNNWDEGELIKIFKEFGEERFSKPIARKIVAERKNKKIKTTGDLVKIILNAVPKRFHYQRIHPATRIFQALRIAVNDELENLKKGLEAGVDILNSDGRIVVISFHSLEDRIVKNFFREHQKKNVLEILTKKPIRPSDEEVEFNPRSRSAKLRCAKRKPIKPAI